MPAIITRHALPIYFILTFVISWGAIYLMAGTNGIPVAKDQAVMLGMALLLGPGVSGIVMTLFTSGIAGLQRLLSRLLNWRVELRWYLNALLVAPLSSLLIFLILTPLSVDYMPAFVTSDNPVSLILSAMMAGLIVGLFEELGWSGFATPLMRQSMSILSMGIVLGLIWGAWHFILFWEQDSFSASLPLALLLSRLFAWLPAYRILMVWVYERTESLLIVVLMHASLVATMIITEPQLSGTHLLVLILVKGFVLWTILTVMALLLNHKLVKI